MYIMIVSQIAYLANCISFCFHIDHEFVQNQLTAPARPSLVLEKALQRYGGVGQNLLEKSPFLNPTTKNPSST